MVSTITGNPILDFTVIQTMSVFYLSEAALHLLKWQDSESRYAGRLFQPPAAAWYAKAGGTRLKMTNDAARPCMKTTGYSIQALSRMAHILPYYRTVSCLSHSSLHREWKTAAALQLQFCLEYQEENHCSPGERSAILEGGACLLHTGHSVEETPDFMPALQDLFEKITQDLDISMISTMELAEVIRGVSVWLKYNNIKQRSDFLAYLALEVLNRKSRSGLFHCSPEGNASASSGQQFFILDALLQSYPFVQLDHILEEVFNLFSNLYRIAYKDTIDLFSFKRRNISYTAFDIGALLTCLNRLAEYSSGESNQRDIINNIIDSFLEMLIQSYNKFHEKEIRKLLRWVCLSHHGLIKRKDKPKIMTVFPKRIHLTYPYLDINWNRKGMTNQTGIFFLSSSLLSLLDKEDTEFPGDAEVKIYIPTLETLKTLLDLFINQL